MIHTYRSFLLRKSALKYFSGHGWKLEWNDNLFKWHRSTQDLIFQTMIIMTSEEPADMMRQHASLQVMSHTFFQIDSGGMQRKFSHWLFGQMLQPLYTYLKQTKIKTIGWSRKNVGSKVVIAENDLYYTTRSEASRKEADQHSLSFFYMLNHVRMTWNTERCWKLTGKGFTYLIGDTSLPLKDPWQHV